VVAAMLRERRGASAQTLSNLLGALREGDYSIRAPGAAARMRWASLFFEANVLARRLAPSAWAHGSSTLLRTVMAEIDVAVLRVFDERQKLRLVNRAGRARPRSAGGTAPRPHGEQLGLVDPLRGETAARHGHDLHERAR